MADVAETTVSSDNTRFSRSKREDVLRFAQTLSSRHNLDLNQWPIFAVVDGKMLSKINKFCVFGNEGNAVIFITEDDDVYAFGANNSSCLGLGTTDASFEPCKIEPLCQKGVTDIAYGWESDPHVFAVTKHGEVYSWGYNGYCQLGNGGSLTGSIPEVIPTAFTGRTVIQVACGVYHSMALTGDGEVYAWGYNGCGQLGDGVTSNRSSPNRVSSPVGTSHVMSIACGANFSMALLSSGQVYAWGSGDQGQLSCSYTATQTTPIIVKILKEIPIAQIVCGYYYTIALSDRGNIYSWGCNDNGQLGIESLSKTLTPTRVHGVSERFMEVAACHYNNISAAMSETGRVYMWGKCRGLSITKPMLTRFTMIEDVFNNFSSHRVTWRMYSVDPVKNYKCKVTESIAGNFDNQENSDVKFQVEGKYIHCHKAILQIRCEHFQSMFKSCWEEGNEDTIKITQYSYTVYRAFLKYLYTDEVDIEPDDALVLLDLSNAYCEQALKMKCEAIVSGGVSVENVIMIYAAAITFEAKHLKEFCFQFAMSHLADVTLTDGYMELDDLTAKNFIRKASKSGAFK